MAAKRALVVDDSKSARQFLARMLEQYAIDVDSAESAEQAIEYLTHHRPPDVIFMDHLMPGMDGFQALTAIKNNPRTATIPVLMYTSQEGELYLGQARALGAVGVLPKQIQQADVSKVLHQLHLLPERRSSEPVFVHGMGAAEERDGGTSGRPLTDAALREHLAELRRALVATLDNQSNRTQADLRATLEQALGRPGRPAGRRAVPWGWIVAALAGIVAGESFYIAHRESVERTALAGEVAQLDALLTGRPGGSASGPSAFGAGPDASAAMAPSTESARVQPASFAQPADAGPVVEVVPFGEAPLAGPRLDALRQLFDRLTAEGYHGTVDIRIFPARFCLIGDSTDGYSLAPDAAAYAQCTLVGADPSEPTPSPQHLSVGFADLAGSFRAASHDAADVQVELGDPKSTLVAYPPVSDSLTAGEWNRAASANNRVEIRVR
ncbi:MAG: response regulator [Steroidobacteraceae bacterium]